MASENPVSEWIELVKEGEADAMNELCDRYFDRLMAHARRRISHGYRAIADEEDIAQSVLDKFCRGAKEGRFENLKNRRDLWRVLAKISLNKIIDDYRRFRRGDDHPREYSESSLPTSDGRSNSFSLDSFSVRSASPDQVLQYREQYEYLMSALSSDEVRQVAKLKLEGASNDEIASKIKRSRRSVERKLQYIRQTWTLVLRHDYS